MTRKLFAGGLLLVVCLGLMAMRVSSQDPPPLTPNVPSIAPPPAERPEASLEQMVKQLRQVRAQKLELDKQEKQLEALLAKKIWEQRQLLDQLDAELRRTGQTKTTEEKTMKDVEKRPEEKKHAP